MIYPFHSTDLTESLPIALRLFGVSHLQPPVKRPDGVPYFQWFYCIKGQGELILNRQRFLIRPGQGFLICPNDPHSYQAVTDDWTLHIFGFDGPLCGELLKTLQMHDSGAYQFTDEELFVRHIEALASLYGDHHLRSALDFSKECYSFLLDISRSITRSRAAGNAAGNELIDTLTSYLERHFASPVTLEELSRIVNLSPDYMCAQFKKEMGITIMQYLTEIRIGHARHLLTMYPEKKVLEIGKMCGFESPSYFGKIFKKEVGMTPEGYRKNM